VALPPYPPFILQNQAGTAKPVRDIRNIGGEAVAPLNSAGISGTRATWEAHETEVEMRTETGRLEGFSDAVFAIAITLLVLDLKVPPPGEPGLLGKLLLDHWRQYLAFLTSFGTIGIGWMYHHELFTLIDRVDRRLLALNMLLLLTVVVVPFPTAVLAAYARHPDAKVAAMFHTGAFVMMAVAFRLLWHYASFRNRLLAPGVDPHVVSGLGRGSALAPALYLASFFLATVSVLGSTLLNGALAVVFLVSVPQPGGIRRPA